MDKMRLMALASAASLLLPFAASAQNVSDDVVKIGVLTDMSGAYSDIGGPGSLAAARTFARFAKNPRKASHDYYPNR